MFSGAQVIIIYSCLEQGCPDGFYCAPCDVGPCPLEGSWCFPYYNYTVVIDNEITVTDNETTTVIANWTAVTDNETTVTDNETTVIDSEITVTDNSSG